MSNQIYTLKIRTKRRGENIYVKVKAMSVTKGTEAIEKFDYLRPWLSGSLFGKAYKIDLLVEIRINIVSQDARITDFKFPCTAPRTRSGQHCASN